MNISLLTMSKAYFTKQYDNVENSTAMSNIEKNQYGNDNSTINNITKPQYNKNFDTVELSNISQKDNENAPTVEKCHTCENRKYQDGSNDPSVSFKTPTAISPDRAAAAVRNHEMEHVFNEQAKALKEDREVVSQSVTYSTNICPECHRVYVSGGETRTVTRNKSNHDNVMAAEKGKFFDAVA
ncbi:hypothetical protein AAK894_06995 [Lachnospiraceae bacterium 46-61]